MLSFAGKHILIIIENLPAPFDRRVWQEATTLKENGAKISIICPKMKGYDKSYEKIDNIEIYRHPLPVEANGAFGYLLEYSIALFWQAVLAWKIFFKKRFQIIHGCNPPYLIFITALPFKLFGVKYIFDHHDLNPELYIAKFDRKDFFYKLMLWLEKLTFKTASYSIATNLSYQEIAINRGKMPADRVRVVRSGPSLQRFKPGHGNKNFKKGKKYLVGYIGIIGEQDGLDLLMQIIAQMKKFRNDTQFAIIGDGTELVKIKKMAAELKISDCVDFYGKISDDVLLNEILNSCEVGVCPDKCTEMNNLSTMNKIMEYMALKKPVVQFDLKEGRASALDASLYARNTDICDFSEKLSWLLDNENERKKMGEYGYQRVLNELSWDYESKKLVSFYKKVFETD